MSDTPQDAETFRHDDWRLALPVGNRRQLRVWLGAVAAMTVLVVLVGGITRLTGSGLSIVDWRPLVGIIPPLDHAAWLDSFERYQQFPEYRQLRPDMTLAEYKLIFFWEYLHRVLARLIGLVFLVPFAWFWARGVLTRPLLHRALVLFGLGALQGGIGWLMVKSGLVDRPSVSHYRLAIHLVFALVIFGLCVWLMRDLQRPAMRAGVPASAKAHATTPMLAFGAVLGLQIVWGAFVAGLKAGYAFNTFPLMGGVLVPVEFWTLTPGVLNLFQVQSGVQWMHRLLGTMLLAAAFVVHRRVRQIGLDRTSRRLSVSLLLAVAAQYALGVLTLLSGVAIVLGVAHQAMAVTLVALWVLMMHHVRDLAVARSDLPGRNESTQSW